jgi:hypothetical protein
MIRQENSAKKQQFIGHPERQCKYLDRIATLELFTPDECTDIINNALNNWEEQESMIQQDANGEIKAHFVKDLDYRNLTLFMPPITEGDLFDKIIDIIMSFNNYKEGYGFDIQGMAELPNMMRYRAADIHPKGKPGKYDWHLDVGPGAVPSMRKLSYSILLNAGEYEGGELEFHTDRDMEVYSGQTTTDACGKMLLFPSYLVHRVRPVTKGIRYAMVGWVHGASFK